MSEASSENSSSPWNTPVIDLGSCMRDCASSPPMQNMLISTAEKTMPTGCRRPTKATMMAAKP